ncbi:MAG TPA: FHA domain-containing protein [Candidatus Obscuribacterales bacterium]
MPRCNVCGNAFEGQDCPTCQTVTGLDLSVFTEGQAIYVRTSGVAGKDSPASLEEASTRRKFAVAFPVCRLGRDPANDVVVNGDDSVSRYHAEIAYEDGAFYVSDRGSTNGTFLNGKPVIKRTALADGDRLRVGRLRFKFLLEIPAGEDGYKSFMPEGEAVPADASLLEKAGNLNMTLDMAMPTDLRGKLEEKILGYENPENRTVAIPKKIASLISELENSTPFPGSIQAQKLSDASAAAQAPAAAAKAAASAGRVSTGAESAGGGSERAIAMPPAPAQESSEVIALGASPPPAGAEAVPEGAPAPPEREQVPAPAAEPRSAASEAAPTKPSSETEAITLGEAPAKPAEEPEALTTAEAPAQPVEEPQAAAPEKTPAEPAEEPEAPSPAEAPVKPPEEPEAAREPETAPTPAAAADESITPPAAEPAAGIEEPATETKAEAPLAPEPAWCNRYLPEELGHLESELSDLNEVVISAQKKIREIESRITLTKGLRKSLLVGRDEELISACSRVLEILGWSIRRSPADKEEIMLESSGKVDAIGRVVWTSPNDIYEHLGKLAMAQVAHWCQHRSEPAGVLIVNAFGHEGIPQGEEADFSEEVQEFARRKNVCVMTTLQLLSIYKELELGGAHADGLRQTILTTTGRLSGYGLTPAD